MIPIINMKFGRLARHVKPKNIHMIYECMHVNVKIACMVKKGVYLKTGSKARLVIYGLFKSLL